MPGLVPGIHVFFSPAVKQDVDGRDNRAFTPVFGGLCPAMTISDWQGMNSRLGIAEYPDGAEGL